MTDNKPFRWSDSRDAPFPFEYGSDLHWFWGWGQRTYDYLADDRTPDQLDNMIFFPDELAYDAIATLGVKYPLAMQPVVEALNNLKKTWEEVSKQLPAPDSDAAYQVATAVQFLNNRIRAAVEAIVEAENSKEAANYSSKRYTPAELRKIFDISQDTLKARLKSQEIRNIKHSSKSYQIHLDDLPN